MRANIDALLFDPSSSLLRHPTLGQLRAARDLQAYLHRLNTNIATAIDTEEPEASDGCKKQKGYRYRYWYTGKSPLQQSQELRQKRIQERQKELMKKLASLKERVERKHRLTVRPNEHRFVLIKKRDEFDKIHFFGNEEDDEEGKYQDPFEDIDDDLWENEKSGPDIDLILSKTPPRLHEMLAQIYLQHQNEFKSEADEKPAKLPPLTLQVDESEWHKHATASQLGIKL